MRTPFAIRSATVATLVLAVSGTLPGQTVLLSVHGQPGEPFFGTAVSDAGDVDGDGWRDLVVGDPFAGEASEGRAQVLSGAGGLPIWAWGGQDPGEEYGAAVAGGIDADADGTPDVLVGAPLATMNGAGSGRAWLRSGTDGGILFAWGGEQPDAHFGAALAFAGDVNADGFCDVVVGSPREGPLLRGAARVFSGRDGALLRLYRGDAADDAFGSAVANAGDVDADGLVDLLVGAPQDVSAPGYARVLRGDDGTVLMTVGTDTPDDRGGTSVAGPGDVDGDGFDDLLVGAPGLDLPVVDAGAALVHSGASGAILRLFPGQLALDAYGSSVSGAGDVDGDGLPDVAAATDAPFGGVVHAHGGMSGLTLLTLLPLGETQTEPLSGLVVGAAGDSNLDGVPDLVVGVPRRVISPDPGEAMVVSTQILEGQAWTDLGGALGGTSGTPSLSGSGQAAAGEVFGLVLSGAPAHAPVIFVLGLEEVDLPFKGGQLVPSPDLVVPGFATDARGGLAIEAEMLAGFAPGTPLVVQAWIGDAGAPLGFAATNGLLGGS